VRVNHRHWNNGFLAAARLSISMTLDQWKDYAEAFGALLGDGFLWKFAVAVVLLSYRHIKKIGLDAAQRRLRGFTPSLRTVLKKAVDTAMHSKKAVYWLLSGDSSQRTVSDLDSYAGMLERLRICGSSPVARMSSLEETQPHMPAAALVAAKALSDFAERRLRSLETDADQHRRLHPAGVIAGRVEAYRDKA
jgi:hypothetical protein